jgi:hypothetical protein
LHLERITSDRATAITVKKTGVAAALQHEIKHSSQMHRFPNREDLGINNAWKELAIMSNTEAILRTTRIYATHVGHPRRKGNLKNRQKLHNVKQWHCTEYN